MLVTPKYAHGMNTSWNLNIFSGPKFLIGCGNCSADFHIRLPLINNPKVACPNCRAVNQLPLIYT